MRGIVDCYEQSSADTGPSPSFSSTAVDVHKNAFQS
jgi:hypothetical protein